ncbi:hypothetical protein HW555_013864, partial [Spodoptera exigua]
MGLLWSPISKGCYLKPVASIPADSKATFILDFLSLCNLSQFNHVKNKNERLLDLVLCTSDVICVEPVEEGNKGNLPHWYSPALRRCLLEKIKYHSRFKKYKNPRDYDAFSMLRSRCKKLEKECYRSFVSRTEECLSSNIKCFWKFVNSKKGSNGLPQTMKLDGVISSDGQVIAELFSGFFGSVFENSSSISTDAMEHYT